MKNIKIEHRVLLATAVSVAVIWVGDIFLKAIPAHRGLFLRVIAMVTAYEPEIRIGMTLSILLFGIITVLMLEKYRHAAEVVRRQSAAMEASMDGIAIYNREGQYVYVNKAYALINGYDHPGDLIGKTYKIAYEDHEVARMEQVCDSSLQKSGRWRGELIAKRKNGSAYFQEASVTQQKDGSRVCIIRDVTWRKRSQERLRRSERFLNMIFDSIRDPFCIFDSEFRIIRANEAYGKLKNKAVSELIGRKCHEVLENSNQVCEGCVVKKSLHSGDPCSKETQLMLQDGSTVWTETFTYPIIDEEEHATYVIEYTRDSTERKKSEEEKRCLIERLQYLSRTDSLTGLMNRRALTDSLLFEGDRAMRYRSELSVILCDIDNFKEINDTYGHDIGDRALQTVSATLKTLLRKTDIFGRYGGDEFLLILPETSVQGAENLADKLLAIVRETGLSAGDIEIRLSLSIGVAGLEAGDENVNLLIKRADSAMYASKQGGRNRVSTVTVQ